MVEKWKDSFLLFKRVEQRPIRPGGNTQLESERVMNKTYSIAHGTLLNVMWQPGWERGLGENWYMYMCG